MTTGIVLSVLIVAIFLLTKLIGRVRATIQAKRQELLNVATSKGWRCAAEGVSGFFTLSGETEGVTWRLEAGREGTNAKSAPSTRWSSDDVAFNEPVLAIRTRRTFDLMQGRFGKLLIRLAQTPGNKAVPNPMMLVSDLLQNGQQLTSSSSTIAAKYAVVVKRDAGLEEVLSADLERALDAWSAVPTRGSYGDTVGVDVGPNVRVYCSFLVEPKHLEQFVNLGVQVVAAVRASSPKSRP